MRRPLNYYVSVSDLGLPLVIAIVNVMIWHMVRSMNLDPLTLFLHPFSVSSFSVFVWSGMLFIIMAVLVFAMTVRSRHCVAVQTDAGK